MKVKLHNSTDEAFIRFDVEDTGIGIPAEKQKEIFECFEQVDDTPSRRYDGTGLGLAIARQLAQLLGGELTLKSELGTGSVFSLVIPTNLDIASQPTFDKSTFDLETSPENDTLLQTKFSGQVLVAEDVLTNQLLIQHLLEKMGFEVTLVDDGNKCVQRALSRSYDLIFMDMQMPNMNGYEATRLLRGKSVDTPIIALTANAMAGDEGRCICAGCDDYLPKPIDRRLLTETILKHIAPKTQAEQIDSIKMQIDELTNLCSQDIPSSEPSKADEPQSVIEWDKLIRRLEDEEIIREVVPLFPQDNKHRINTIAEAIDSGDTKKMKSSAHAIKGAALNIGAGRLSDLAASLEVAGHKQQTDQYSRIFDQLAVEFEKVVSFISQPNWHEIAKQQTETAQT
jgi:CheY-like chemotaxis protein